MSLYRRIEIATEPSIFTTTATTTTTRTLSFLLEDDLDFLSLDLLPFTPSLSDFHFFSDLVQIPKPTRRVDSAALTRHHLRTLSDRVSALELAFDRAAAAKKTHRHVACDRKYTWEAEIRDLDRKYKVTAESKGEKKSYKWTAEIKDGDDVARSYTFKAVSGEGIESSGEGKIEKKEKREKKKGGCKHGKRAVEIEEVTPDHGAVVLRQAFAKRDRCRGKRKELSPQDAAMMIQMTFKAYLIRRSQALRALRELAVAKAKLKELRVLFNNFTYRRRVACDAEERQRFTERIIVVLLTVDSIEGADVMVRAAKRSMTDELEAMLDVVDPQPSGKTRFIKRRTFDMPDGIIHKDLAAGVAEVVQMLDQENGNFEACL